MEKYEDDGTVVERVKSGRPRKLSLVQEKKLMRHVEANPKLTASAIAKNPKLNQNGFHYTTISRYLNKNGLRDSIEMPKQITQEHMMNKLDKL